jgi:SAM-dependent methyltransferase
MNWTHLSPSMYSRLQEFVHRGHGGTFQILVSLLGLKQGETVVEIGCGTGTLGRHFVAAGYDYWGIDIDPGRIASARGGAQRGKFLVGDAASLRKLGLPPCERIFIHGVLHHLGDVECLRILEGVLLAPRIVLAVIEPYDPSPWWSNPLGAFCARLDEGRHFRTLQGWRDLFGPYLNQWRTRSIWPRWPVPFVDARLQAPLSNPS